MKRTTFCLLRAALALFCAASVHGQIAPSSLRRPSPSPSPTASPAPERPAETAAPAETPAPTPAQTPPPPAATNTPAAESAPRRSPQAFPRITPSGAAATRPHQEHPREDEKRAQASAKREKPPREKREKPPREKRERKPWFRRVPGRQPVERPASRPTFDLSRSNNWRVNGTLRGLESRWQDAVKAKNADALEKLLDDDFVRTTASGRRLSKTGLLRTVRNDTNTYRSARVQKTKVRMIRENTAIVEGIVTESGRTESGERFSNARRFTNTWKLRGGKWLCVSSEVSDLPKR